MADNERATQAEAWLDRLARDEIDGVIVEDTSDLSRVALAIDKVNADQHELLAAVEQARARGRSWTQIAHAMGVTRQAARQRFHDQIPA